MEDMHLLLRAHHLLCIPQYQGSGYSKDFCRQMEKVIKILRKQKHKITILDVPDILCSHCPNLIRDSQEEQCDRKERPEGRTEQENCGSEQYGCEGMLCEKETEIIRKDRTLLKGLHLETETAYEPEKLKAAVRLSMTQELFCKACGDCEWLRRGFCGYELWKEKFYDTF